MSALHPTLLPDGLRLTWVLHFDVSPYLNAQARYRLGVAKIHGDERFVGLCILWPHEVGQDMDAWIESVLCGSVEEAQAEVEAFAKAWGVMPCAS